MKRSILAAIVAVLVVATPAFAGHKPHAAGTTTSTLAVSPTTVTVGSSYTISGSGYAPGIVNISAADPGCCAGFAVTADDSGSFSYDAVATEAGFYRIETVGVNSSGQVVVLASVSFTVS